MRKLNSSDHISNRIDARDICHEEFIDKHFAVIHANLQVCCKQFFRIRFPSHRYQHCIRGKNLLFPFGHQMTAYTMLFFLEPLYQTFLIHMDSTPDKNLLQSLSKLNVHRRKKPLSQFYHSHFWTERLKYSGNLQSNDTASYNNQPVITSVLRLKQFFTRHYFRQLLPRKPKFPRRCSGSN